MIKICVPSRFEPALLDELEPLQAQTGRIHEIYGSLPRTRLGGGRSTARLRQQGAEVGFQDVRAFTERAHAAGIRVNYLMNGSCLDLTEYTREGHDAIVQYVEEIVAAGVDMVTIAVPYLVEIVTRRFPEMPVSVSAFAGIGSPHGLRLIERHGVQRVQVAEECNRDLPLLGELSSIASCDLSLIVNNGCLRYCPYRFYHNNLCSQSSQSGMPPFIDYPLLKCQQDRIASPVEIMRSPWIRPEDLPYYEERFGIELFKIAGRQLPLARIVTMARAYAQLSYEGNFLDLLATPSANFAHHPMTAALARERDDERFTLPHLEIDNGRLGGFTRALHARGGCRAERDCEECRLCDEMLPRVLSADDAEARADHAELLDELISELAGGSWTADGAPARPVSGAAARRP